MRSTVAVLAAVVLAVAGCSGGSDDQPDGANDPDTRPTGQPTEDSPIGGGDDTDATATAEPDDQSEDAEQAAATAKSWMTAMARGDTSACDIMADSSGEAPLAESGAEYELCLAEVPQIAESQFTDEVAAILAAIEINGAEVTDDSAVIDERHFSEFFAESFDGTRIVLVRFDDTWYVDLSSTEFG